MWRAALSAAGGGAVGDEAEEVSGRGAGAGLEGAAVRGPEAT